MKTYAATVLGRRRLSAHLVTVTLGELDGFASTGIPDEYVRVLIPPAGAELAIPEIDDDWNITYPEGAAAPEPRVYTSRTTASSTVTPDRPRHRAARRGPRIRLGAHVPSRATGSG